MSEHKPFFKRLADEVDAFIDLWNKRRGLAISGIVLLLIFMTIWGFSWYNRGIKIENLQTDKKNLVTELNIIRTENKSLRETVAPLLKQATDKFPGEEINVALQKLASLLQKLDPYEQPIRTATATVQVTIESDEQVNTTYMGQGGYVAFGKGAEALIIMLDRQCRAKQNGKGQVIYRGVFSMDAAHPASGKPLSFLKEAEYVQIVFKPMPPKSKVVTGEAICILNSQERIEFKILPQQMPNDKIFVRDLKNIFN